MWETSSLASSQLRRGGNSANIGQGNLFHGRMKSSLNSDRLQMLQEQLVAVQTQAQLSNVKVFDNTIKNRYIITNSNAVDELSPMDSHKTDDSTAIAAAFSGDDEDDDMDSDNKSVINDRDIDDDSLLRIGMEDSATAGKNKASTDQWVAKEFHNKEECVIS